jgi:hypothetical protein
LIHAVKAPEKDRSAGMKTLALTVERALEATLSTTPMVAEA